MADDWTPSSKELTEAQAAAQRDAPAPLLQFFRANSDGTIDQIDTNGIMLLSGVPDMEMLPGTVPVTVIPSGMFLPAPGRDKPDV